MCVVLVWWVKKTNACRGVRHVPACSQRLSLSIKLGLETWVTLISGSLPLRTMQLT